ncbi:MAG: aldose epimerase family protein, partial [Spirochaetota bacterium]
DREVLLYTLENSRGMQLKISDYGGIITHWTVPDRNGEGRDIVLGFDRLEEYLAGHPFLGCIVGRFANRIDKGRFTLEGQEYELAAQANGNHLHGGRRGFDKYIWDSRAERKSASSSLILGLYSPDGDEGYPGALDVEVRYTLFEDKRFRIDYKARLPVGGSQATIVNLSNHSYFNLNGNPERGIENHNIQIHADRYVEVDPRQIPTGNLPALAGNSLDCRSMRYMGEIFAAVPDAVVDHCYVLTDSLADSMGAFKEVSIVEAPESGIRMRLLTDNVGVQFYNGNKLGNTNQVGKQGLRYVRFAGFCLETQCFPDTPNHAHFPSCILQPGEIYTHSAEFHFENF